MKHGVEKVISAPLASSTPIKSQKSGSSGKGSAENGNPSSISTTTTSNTTTSNTTNSSSMDSDHANGDESGGFVTLDVTFPDGQRSDVSVDCNTPMLDLLVSLAARSRLSPSGLGLELVSQESGKLVSYTPNQTIGSLEGRVVHVVNKEAISVKLPSKGSKKEQPFEVTQRFTVNLPTGQKTVLRASPLTSLGDLVISACKEKGLDLDLDKYVLQLPKKPGIPIDPRATMQQTGIQEVTLVSIEQVDRNYTMSMPDLSKMPPSGHDPHLFAHLNGQPKKKRGFLSFLVKKEKKYPPEVRRSLVVKSTSNLDVNAPSPTRTNTLPEPGSPETPQNHQISRPKSMFVSSDITLVNEKPQEQQQQNLIAPPRKKRRAPEPPISPNSHITAQALNMSAQNNVQVNIDMGTESISMPPEQSESKQQETVLPSVVLSQSTSYQEVPNDFSRVQHELNLSGCEPHKTVENNEINIHSSINASSLNSANTIIQDNSKILSSNEKKLKDTLEENSVLKINTKTPQPAAHSSLPGDSHSLSSNKKKKAPVPQSSVLTSLSSTIASATTLSPHELATTLSTVETPTSLPPRKAATTLSSSVESATALPSKIESATALPSTIESGTALPSKIESATALPSTIESGTALPSKIESANKLPSKIESATALPSTIESATALPSTIESATKLPSKIESVTTLPSTIESATTLPSRIESATTLPSTIEFATTLPSTLEPASTLPSAMEPASTSMEVAASSSDIRTPAHEQDCVHLIQAHSEMELSTTRVQQEISTSTASEKHLEIQSDFIDQSVCPVAPAQHDWNEPTTDNFNDILDGVIFDEEPWLPELTLAKRAGVGVAQTDPMMMMETASVTSEDIDQTPGFSHPGRPCAFVPPPPPTEPPPPDRHSADLGPHISTTAPIFVDKGTGVSEDNASLAASSPKSSPSRTSYSGFNEMALFIEQMDSITLENQTDAEEMVLNDTMKEVYVSIPQTSTHSGSQTYHVQAETSHPRSVAKSVTSQNDQELSKDAIASTVMPGNHSMNSFSVSEEFMNNITLPPPPQFEDEVDALPEDKSIFEEQVEERSQRNEGKTEKEAANELKTEKEVEKEEEEDEDEEYFTEIIEVIPLGPKVYDFAADRKPEDTLNIVETIKDREKSDSSGIISAETDLIRHKPVITSVYHLEPKQERPYQLSSTSKKEEFVLTTEDLSKVNFLPPKHYMEKSSFESELQLETQSSVKEHPSMENQSFVKGYPSVDSQSSVHVPSKSLVTRSVDNSVLRSTTTSRYTPEYIPSTVAQNSAISKSKPQQISASKEQPSTWLKMPVATPGVHIDSVSSVYTDESMYSNDPLLTKSRPHLLMNSHSNPLRRAAVDNTRGADYSRKDVYSPKSFIAGVGAGAMADSREQASAVTSAYNTETPDQQDAFQRQYLALKSQIQHWQEQLAWNQSQLASQAVGSEPQTGHFQQLSGQMAVQQELAMQQLQSTLLALQQQQQHHVPAGSQDNGELSAELPAKIHQPVAGAAEPTYLAAASTPPPTAISPLPPSISPVPPSISSPPPPISPPPPPILKPQQKQSSILKSGVSTVKKRPNVERELGPREQLMIAIRTFPKRDLKSVPIEMTRWTPSALS